MKRTFSSIVVLASLATAGYAFAQDTKQPDASETSVETPKDGQHLKRGPIDLETFSRLDDIKAIDTNDDGTLSRQEIEDHALKQMVKRIADRMERRMDVNGDGTVTIAEVEKQKQKEFAALDRNEDGKIDRKEMRAAHKGGKSFGKHGRHGGHGFHHHKMHQQK